MKKKHKRLIKKHWKIVLALILAFVFVCIMMYNTAMTKRISWGTSGHLSVNMRVMGYDNVIVIKDGMETTPIVNCSIEYTDICKITTNVQGEYTVYGVINGTRDVLKKRYISGETVWVYRDSYLVDSGSVTKGKLREYTSKVASSITDDKSFALQLYAYLSNIDYNEELAEALIEDRNSAYKPSATAVFEEGKGICTDIASAGVLIARYNGFSSRMVVTETHAWYEIQIDGKWEQFDPVNKLHSMNGDTTLCEQEYVYKY